MREDIKVYQDPLAKPWHLEKKNFVCGYEKKHLMEWSKISLWKLLGCGKKPK